MKTNKLNPLAYYFIIICLFLSFSSQATTYYVSSSGNNSNDGSSSSPWKTINYAIGMATPGTTIIVEAGEYNEAVNINKSGSASAGYIILQTNAGAIIDGAGIGVDYLINISNQQYVKVIGFEVQNLKRSGTPIGISIEGSGNYIEIRNNKVHHIENTNGNAHGIAVYGTSTTPVSNILIDGNEIYSCKLGQSESMVLNGNVTDFVVSKNIVHDNDNIGIDFIGFEGNAPSGYDQARNGICVDNKVYNISSASNPTYGGDRCADGIYVDGGKDIIIERNIVDNCDIAIEIASEHGGKATSNITIRNNFATRSYQGNIMVGGYASNKGDATDINIVNNTSYMASDGEIILQYNCDRVTIKNNILYAKSGNSYLDNAGSNNTNISVDNNLYFGSSNSSPGSWSDAHAIYTNPNLISPPSNLHIQAGSPAIDKGVNLATTFIGSQDVDGELRISNGSIDIGADEVRGSEENIPAAPSSLAASAISVNQINLTWTDNASDEDGFRIERSTDAGSTWSLVANAESNVTAYSNSGLASETTYHYRVRAENATGNSAFSSTAQATTLNSGVSTSIVVDGNASDWDEVPTLTTNGAGGLTILKATNDDSYLYFLVQGTNISNNYILFINSDNINTTGFESLWSPEGSDFNIENGTLYKHSGSSTNWGWSAVSGADVESVKTSTVIEIRVAKSSLVGLANTIGLGMDVENSSWNTVATIPAAESAMTYYTLNGGISNKNAALTKTLDSFQDVNLKNFPNPFNGSTEISYSLANESKVKLTICDFNGLEIQTLANENQMPGNYSYTFNSGSLKTGIYYAKIALKNKVKVIKLVSVR